LAISILSPAQEGTMLEILQFVFQDFWHWLGTFFLLAVLVGGISQLFNGPRINRTKRCDGTAPMHRHLQILGRGRASEESKKVERALGNVALPPWVASWEYSLGSPDEVWMNVYARENVATSDYNRFITQIIPEI